MNSNYKILQQDNSVVDIIQTFQRLPTGDRTVLVANPLNEVTTYKYSFIIKYYLTYKLISIIH
jgi:hypothetical protein